VNYNFSRSNATSVAIFRHQPLSIIPTVHVNLLHFMT